MLPSETMIWQPEFTDKTLSRKTGAVHLSVVERKWKTVIYAKRKVKKEPIKRNPDGTGWGCANPMTAFINRALMEVRQ
ncbi:hypothetical protein [Escherichia coli]|uniref:hypothetical protein n=1 Tax=Escherichia coli TaxID=562 RepID=UPI00148508A9|nr:hypothetical protein [Escherichia coli]